ncbi:UNKNOWN [Stylonychia lemnae]|uniref:Uncharacterized protein n=1 Tax=Stylonychia lemnae TaxID=5949 RepID=A0A078BBR7_STYLE|nr:UNKNOWN [Stylonychia lemnae]|eukprot:CDW90702.1 UNKNOWN [Stylonychia lemnae]
MKKGNPASSKLLQKKWRQKDYEGHLARLQQVRPGLELNAPGQFNHLKTKAKKEQILEVQQPTHINMGLTQQNSQMNSIEEKKSLNRDFRKRELLRVTLENYEFLKRLNQKGSAYSVTKWEEEFKQKEKLLKSLSEFPQFYEGHAATQTSFNTKRISKRTYEKTERSRADSVNNTILQPSEQKQKIIKIHEEMLIKITKNANLMSPETFKYYTTKYMKKELFDIHIYRTRDEIFLIDLPKPKSIEVLASFDNDYELLCDFLDIKKNRLVILNPKKANKNRALSQKPLNQSPEMQEVQEDRVPNHQMQDSQTENPVDLDKQQVIEGSLDNVSQ